EGALHVVLGEGLVHFAHAQAVEGGHVAVVAVLDVDHPGGAHGGCRPLRRGLVGHHHGCGALQPVGRFGHVAEAVLGAHGELLLAGDVQLHAEIRGGRVGNEAGELAIDHHRADAAGVVGMALHEDLVLVGVHHGYAVG